MSWQQTTPRNTASRSLRLRSCCCFSGDIADPQHPFRFHQVVSSLRRTVTPVDPAQPSTQSQPSSPAGQASAHWHTARNPSSPSSSNQPPSGPTEDAHPREQSSHAGTHFAQSASDRLTAKAADQPASTADSLHNQASDAPVQTGDAGQNISGNGGGNSQETGFDAEVLRHSTMSRGGPVPGAQVSGLTPLNPFGLLTAPNAVLISNSPKCIAVC